ncbi:sialomucin core protein 24 [Varanus komodoensis]|uniref:CD164 molecule n=1 Tax=Varanus komodoensis TaxID=61221 RepID=A0A8D2KTR2_VARKO|nr:sialomucin core protein 24 [Varanus komodoensis]
MSCGGRPLRGPLGWALLLLGLASCFISPLAADAEKVACEKYTNCSSCIENSETCIWLQCNEINQSQCINKTEKHINCTVVSQNGTCQAPSNGSTTITPVTAGANTTASTIPSTTHTPVTGNVTLSPSLAPRPTSAIVTTASASTPGSVSPKPTSKPSPHKSTFDAASFIGGIVLVLGLQAVIFFLYKFCKSKEQNYHTL